MQQQKPWGPFSVVVAILAVIAIAISGVALLTVKVVPAAQPAGFCLKHPTHPSCASPSPSPTPSPPPTPSPTSSSAAADLRALVENVAAATHRYGMRDNLGNSMDTLKIINRPGGGYLGVYHVLSGTTFNVKLASSSDLLNWTYLRDLDANASQPYLALVTDGTFVLADEAGPSLHLRFKHYASLSALLAGTSFQTFEAPRTLSNCAEGTPNIYSATPTLLDVGLHYFSTCTSDRQARGTLTNWSTWNVAATPAVDAAIAAPGNHGDRDHLTFEQAEFTLIEGQLTQGSFASWRIFQYDLATGSAPQLNIRTNAGSTAFANPSITDLGGGLTVVTLFLPSEGAAAGEGGELVYYRGSLPSASPTPSPSPTSTASPTSSPSPTATSVGGDPFIAAAGDIACATPYTPTTTTCQHAATAQLLGSATTVLTLGDNQYETGSLAQFNASYAPYWGVYKTETRPSVGNHEYGTSNAQGYRDYFGLGSGPLYYSFDVGSWHLIALDSEISVAVGSTQYNWLVNDLNAHVNACTLAYWHQPRFSTGQHGNNATYQPLWQALYDRNADLILNGHDHDYERFAPQTPTGTADNARGIREFVVGTGGKSHYSTTGGGLSEVHNSATFGVLRLDLHASSYDFRFLPEAGKTFSDSGSGACH